MSDNDAANSTQVQRPRLNLKPRDPEAAARIESERQHSLGKVCVQQVRSA